jgi:hypothetical protein
MLVRHLYNVFARGEQIQSRLKQLQKQGSQIQRAVSIGKKKKKK